MGSEDWADSKPPHRVAIKSFQMAKTLVTNRQYRACMDAGACTAPADCGESSVLRAERDPRLDPEAPPAPSGALKGADYPVVCVDWDQAKAFAQWVGGRLPTEAEWEYAARSAGKDRKYPWGDEDPTCDRVVRKGCTEGTMPVCSKPLGNTEQGLCDMASNVWEWTQDWYHDSYDGAPDDGGAWESPAGSIRVVRGAAWFCASDPMVRSAHRHPGPAERSIYNGFRPVRSR